MNASHYRCRACGTVWPASEAVTEHVALDVRTCADATCGGTCDPVAEPAAVSDAPFLSAAEARVALCVTSHEPWFHRHPMGGLEIYQDAETNEPLATFGSEADCDKAIAAHNMTYALGIAPAAVPLLLEALKAYEEALSDGPENCSFARYEAVSAQARVAISVAISVAQLKP